MYFHKGGDEQRFNSLIYGLMKKAIAYICLLFIFVSQTQIGTIYAQETTKVEAAQEQ
jgi:hypothetical protein